MPVVNYEQYLNMMKAAYDNHYAYPAVNVSSMETANAVQGRYRHNTSTSNILIIFLITLQLHIIDLILFF